MNEGHFLIECAKEADRDTLTVILVRNGYTVRRARAKVGKATAWTYYIEYWRQGDGKQ